MKLTGTAIALIMLLSLTAWKAPDKADPATIRAKAITAAAPYIADALKRPMLNLYQGTQAGDGFDALRMGLAMFAGREMASDGDSEKDEDTLGELERRVLPLSDAYLGAHPDADYRKVDWVKVLHATDKDLKFVEHYQRRHSADYWLTAAAEYQSASAQLNVHRPSLFPPEDRPLGVFNVSRNAQVDSHLFVTAAQCVRAVRVAAGVTYHGPRDLPMSILLLRDSPYADLDRAIDHLAPDPAQAVGADACGTKETFKGYVAALNHGG